MTGSRTARTLGLMLVVGVVLVSASPGTGEAQENTITEVRVEGNQRIEDSTILSNLTVRPGQQIEPGSPFDPLLLDTALKSLFETGLFADVTFVRDGTTLIVRVVENPIVNQVVFEGNQRIDNEDLAGEINLRQRTVFTRSRARTDQERLLTVYRRSGRFGASVVPKVILLDQNRVNVVFEIDEGPLTGIESINFVGNRRFSDGDLRDVMRTRESRWWRFLSSSDRYDPDQLAFDEELLRRHYFDRGYLRFRILSSSAELLPDGDAFLITIAVEEGDRYTFSDVTATSALPEVDVEPLRELIETETGDEYNRTAIQDTIGILSDAVVTAGFPFVQVDVEPDIDDDARTVALHYHLVEGERLYVDRIEIKGNVRTLDHVVRRYLRLSEGDPLNRGLLARSRTLVGNLGFFSDVQFQEVPGRAADQRDIELTVEERSTGEISFGLGYSTSRGAIGNVSLRERNLLGTGSSLTIALENARTGGLYSLAYSEPYFRQRDLSLSTSVFSSNTDRIGTAYESDEQGARIGFGFSLGEYLRQRLTYGLTWVRVTGREEVQVDLGRRVISAVTSAWTYDRRDSALLPSKGYNVGLSTTLAGLGGDDRYARLTVNGGYYTEVLWDEWVLGLLVSAGIIEGIGQDVSIYDRFLLGDRSFRGFEYAGIGPRYLGTGRSSALGGNMFATATAELKVDLGLPRELGMHGRIFGIVGTLTGIDRATVVTNGGTVVDSGSARASAGVGLSWSSPVGPVRIDWTSALAKESYDRTETILFSLGSTF
ncbi:MAG: outer membrane protein assembly factor BamA [Rhodospirillales bacterium]|nr:outer membrane protein assembly factor BamA [Rhodospirillales bacterium]